MKQLLFILLFCTLLMPAFAQRHRHEAEIPAAEPKPGEKGSYKAIERYDVLKTDSTVKEGRYETLYEGVPIISGNYTSGAKNGTFNYQNIDGKISFRGSFTMGIKNGCWRYLHDQKPAAVVYYRNGAKDSTWQFYYPSGKPEASITYSMNKLNGPYTVYYENGKTAIDALYRNDTLVGTEKTFYKDGTVRYTIEYKNGNPYNVLVMNDTTGKPLDYGTLKDGTGSLIQYGEKNMLYSEVEYSNGRKNGTARFYSANQMPQDISHYTDDVLNGKQTSYYSDGTRFKEGECSNGLRTGPWISYNQQGRPTDTTRYTVQDKKEGYENHYKPSLSVSEEYPVAQGDENGMMYYIMHNVIYPSDAKEAGTSGVVYVTFVVAPDGQLDDVRVLRGRSPELDEEALRVVKNMPSWSPGFENGLPVSVQFNLPIKFSLR